MDLRPPVLESRTDECATCGRAAVQPLVTYKHVWLYCDACGCLSRTQRERYPLEWLAALLRPFARSERAKRVLSIIGRKPGGQDFYRYYERFLTAGDRDKWAGEYARMSEFLASIGLTLRGRTLLDVSGEPGFFAKDAQEDGAVDPVVTAFADNVPAAITKHLGLGSFQFDFNRDRIEGRYDAVLSRWGIGFCTQPERFFSEVAQALNPGGLFIIQHPPSSKGMCSRWMFDDYTYLRAFTREKLIEFAAAHGLVYKGACDEGSYHYAKDWNVVMRALIGAYRLMHPALRQGSDYHHFQHNETIVFVKP